MMPQDMQIPPRGTRGLKMPNVPRPLMHALNAVMYRIFRHNFRGSPLLRLYTVGAKSGLARTTTVAYLPDGDNRVIVASAGGTASHPAWYFNLARNPDQVWIDVDGRKLHVRPEPLEGAERDAIWQRIIAQSPSFAAYPEKTDRQIPIIRLREIS